MRRLLALLARREDPQSKAGDLIAVYGETAYAEARKIARRERNARRPREVRFWSRVALEIARREGREVGVTGADRYRG